VCVSRRGGHGVRRVCLCLEEEDMELGESVFLSRRRGHGVRTECVCLCLEEADME
jgi:hypothetical protein